MPRCLEQALLTHEPAESSHPVGPVAFIILGVLALTQCWAEGAPIAAGLQTHSGLSLPLSTLESILEKLLCSCVGTLSLSRAHRAPTIPSSSPSWSSYEAGRGWGLGGPTPCHPSPTFSVWFVSLLVP